MSNTIMTKSKTKLDVLLSRLRKPGGATIEELMKVTGWQSHSIRGVMAGSLKKKGHVVSSTKVDGKRRYKLEEAADA